MLSIDVTKGIEGMYTIDTFAAKLGITKSTAANRISKLRKAGYVTTKGGGRQPRIYMITPYKRIAAGNPGPYDLINKYSPIKISPKYEYRVVGRKLTVEEAIIMAIDTHDYRVILASLALFNHVNNWSLLHKLARENRMERAVGALYDTARLFIRVRRMDKKTRKTLLNSKETGRFIIEGMKSDDFGDVEREWKIRIPFNRQDMMRYKEWQPT